MSTHDDDRPTTELPEHGDAPTAEQTAVDQPAVGPATTEAPSTGPGRLSATRRVVAGAGVGLVVAGGLVGFGIGNATAGDDGHRGGFAHVGPGDEGQRGPDGYGRPGRGGPQGGPGRMGPGEMGPGPAQGGAGERPTPTSPQSPDASGT